jgi:hypothetical protein
MCWLDPTAAVDALLLVACGNSTSGMSPKAACSGPSAILERFWVGGWFGVEAWGKAPSPGH